MTKEERIRALVQEQIEVRSELQEHLTKVDTLRKRITNISKEVNLLSHLIRNPSNLENKY